MLADVSASRPRRVLMTADTMGGVWTFVVGLARSLAASGVRVTIATMGEPARAAQRAEVAALEGVELAESTYRLEWMDDPWRDVARAGEWLLELEQLVRPDVVHVNGYAHAALPFRAPPLVTAHSCVLSWWRAVHGEDAPVRYQRYREEVSRGVALARAVVAPTRAMLDAVVHHYAPRCPLHVIPNAIERGEMRAGEVPKEELVFSAGRLWDPAKNVAALDDAAPHVRWPIVVAGSTEGEGGRDQAPKHVRSLGWIGRDEVARWMARASIYAHPARYEPFGLSVLEAALARCALVLGDIPSLREIWGDAAVYVPPGDAVALAHALTRLSGDAKRREDLAARAHARAVLHSPERMAGAYLAVYQKLRAPRAVAGSELSCA